MAAVAAPAAQAVGSKDCQAPSASDQLSADRPAKTPKAKRSKRTPEDDNAIRAGLVPLAGWFGYGMPGVRTDTTAWVDLAPTDTNWFHWNIRQSENVLNDVSPTASKLQVAAYAWWALNCLRHSKGLSLILPTTHDLMGDPRRAGSGVLGNLYEQRGPAATVAFVCAATNLYDDIILASAKLDNPPTPTGGFFRHGMTAKIVDRYEADDLADVLDGDESGMEGLL
ncbi:MAG: hypothetical protein IAG10_29190 [Planctomycetaceae bacterium]|nr:hypothetical protein [Planctomycetaceae bacterium]